MEGWWDMYGWKLACMRVSDPSQRGEVPVYTRQQMRAGLKYEIHISCKDMIVIKYAPVLTISPLILTQTTKSLIALNSTFAQSMQPFPLHL